MTSEMEKDDSYVNPVKVIEDDESTTSCDERRLLRRLDIRLVAACGLGYAVSLMDRTNVGFAAITGMIKELGMTSSDYSLVVLIFFVPYILFQPPATVLIRRFGPPKFLSAIVMAWGVLMIGLGFAKTWEPVIVVRILLGLFAAGYFPGCVYLLSCWYRRFEIQKRFSAFYCIGVVCSSLSGILSYGLSQMKGLAGLGGWSWIFILEGMLTCILSVALFFLIVDFPDKAHSSWKFLTKEECQFFIDRVDRDRADGGAPEPFTLGRFLRPALDLKLWGYAMIFLCLTINTYAMAYFAPIILVEDMGFDVGATQCLSTPPWVFAGIMMFVSAYFGDKYHTRAPLMICNALLSIVGLPLMGYGPNNGSRLLGVFLTIAGANANVPTCLAWQANNVRGQWKRAFSSATLVGFDGIGGIIASLVFEIDSPRYRPGIGVALGANILIILITLIMVLWFRHCNKQAERGERVIEGDTDFRYTI